MMAAGTGWAFSGQHIAAVEVSRFVWYGGVVVKWNGNKDEECLPLWPLAR